MVGSMRHILHKNTNWGDSVHGTPKTSKDYFSAQPISHIPLELESGMRVLRLSRDYDE
jgi:hypothetical protein